MLIANGEDFSMYRSLSNEEMKTMKPSEEIVRFFEKDRFAAETGAVIDEIDDRYARCSLTLEAKHKNALGAVMGGVYFTLADFAFAVASNWQGDTMVSLNSQIAYLGAAKGNMLIAEAVCLKDGRTTAYYEIRIKDELGNTAAVVSTTGYKLTKL